MSLPTEAAIGMTITYNSPELSSPGLSASAGAPAFPLT